MEHVFVRAPGVSINADGPKVSVNVGEGIGNGPMIQGSGVNKTETRDVPGFHAIQAESGIEVHYSRGADQTVKAEGDDNIVPTLETKVEDGTLKISHQGNYSTKCPLVVTVQSPNLDSIQLDGACRGKFENLDTKELSVELDGGSSLDANGNIKDLNLDLSGSAKLNGTFQGGCEIKGSSSGGSTVALAGDLGSVDFDESGASTLELKGIKAQEVNLKGDGGSRATLNGVTQSLTLEAGGACDMELKDLAALDCKIEAEGGSRAKVTATNSLTADLSAAASVQYAGHPGQITKNLEGGADLSPL